MPKPINLTEFRSPDEFKGADPFSSPNTSPFARPDLTDWSSLGLSQSRPKPPTVNDASRTLLHCGKCGAPASKCKCGGA